MKKVIVSLLAVSACCLLAVGLNELSVYSSVSAQADDQTRIDGRNQTEKDREMAKEIARVTNRSSEGLVSKETSDGIEVDLDGRFQNVMLARLEGEGEFAAACVTSLGEANSFFGKDLETGERIPKTRVKKIGAAKVAADHGMSETEFEFYRKLIEEYQQRLALSPQAATITIINNDGTSPAEGFNDPLAPVVPNEGGNPGATRGAQRLNVFNHAAGIWGAFLDSSITTTVNSHFDPLACSAGSAVLGSAGAATLAANFTNAPFTNTWYHGALANKIRNVDGSAGSEINATFNSNLDNGCFSGSARFYYGLDGTTPASTTNLLVVVLHELGHGLGFSSFINGSTGALFNGPPALPDVYSRFMFDQTVGLYWDQMSDAQRQASAINNGNVFWDGANVRIASSFLTSGRDAATGRVALHTPGVFAPGSSVSHFTTAAFPNLLMEPNINTGLAIDGDLTRQQMRDIGWFRDSTADVTADTITGVSPFGGAAVVGTTRTINWANNGGFNRNVNIELSTDGGTTFPTVIAANTPNTGTFAWTVPNMQTATARIRVREADFAAPSGTSASNFVISLAPLAGGATVAGRVLGADGRPIGRATVTLVNGIGIMRTTNTNSFGYFVFGDVPVGEIYVANVRHKHHVFEQRVVNLSDDFAGLDFVATQ